MRSDSPRAAAIIVASGTGDRFGAPGGKQLALVAGLPVLSHTLLACDAAQSLGLLVVVCHPDRLEEFRSRAIEPLELATPWLLVAGGLTRTDSVHSGLRVIDQDWPYVMVHDGARPLVLPGTIDDALSALADRSDVDGIVLGQPSYDTLKEVSGERIVSTPDRSRYWVVQTPQVFRAPMLRRAYEQAGADAPSTDDAALVEVCGGIVHVMEGPRDNIKVTVAEDLAIVEAVLRYREAG
ncbi:MAG: 2-C-methyl-D-erythritol 4-phosphate cytidylyltransferase [Coriobacteriia bacterium]